MGDRRVEPGFLQNALGVWGFDHFLVGEASVSGNGSFADNCFVPTVGGTGSQVSVTNGAVGIATRPGILAASTGSTNAGVAGIAPGGSGSTWKSIRLGGGVWRYGIAVQIPVLSVALQRFFVFAGFAQDRGSAPAKSIGFCYNDNVNSAKWFARTKNVGGSADTDLAIAPVAGTWYNLEMEINAAANSVEFFIDGVSKATVTANIPTASGDEVGACAFIVKTVGTSAATVNFDWVYLQHETTSPAVLGASRFL